MEFRREEEGQNGIPEQRGGTGEGDYNCTSLKLAHFLTQVGY